MKNSQIEKKFMIINIIFCILAGIILFNNEDIFAFTANPLDVIMFCALIITNFAILKMPLNFFDTFVVFNDGLLVFAYIYWGLPTTILFAIVSSLISDAILKQQYEFKRKVIIMVYNSAFFVVSLFITSITIDFLSSALFDYFTVNSTFLMKIILFVLILNVLSAIMELLINRLAIFNRKSYLSNVELISILGNMFTSLIMSILMYFGYKNMDILGCIFLMVVLVLLYYANNLYVRMKNKDVFITKILNLTNHILDYGNFEIKCNILVEELKKILPYKICALYLFNNDELVFPVAFDAPKSLTIEDLQLNVGPNATTIQNVRDGDIYICKDTTKDENIKLSNQLKEHASNMILVPIMKKEELIGVIMITGDISMRLYNVFEKDAFSVLSKHLSLAIVNDTIYTKLKNHASRDGLTDLFNRRVLDQEMDKLIVNKEPFSFAIFDIDDFKKVNDTYGHLAGDEILKKVSSIISESIRSTDMCFRYGGEEICVLFKNLNKENTLKITNRIRAKIENNISICNEQEIKVTISGGISEYNRDGEDKETIIKNADDILYNECKKKGKNKVDIYR